MTASPAAEPVRAVVVIEDRYAKELEIVQSRLGSLSWKSLDAVDAVTEGMEQQQLPLHHVFTPGLYVREVFMPKGSIVTTRIHLTEHPFVISAGVVSVWSDETGWKLLRAPHTGVTKPGTRRLLYIHEDTIWSTFHVTDKTNPDEIVLDVTYTGGKFHELRGAAATKPELLEAKP